MVTEIMIGLNKQEKRRNIFLVWYRNDQIRVMNYVIARMRLFHWLSDEIIVITNSRRLDEWC